MHGLACRRRQKYYGNSQAGTRRIGVGREARGELVKLKWWFLNRFQILMSEETQRVRVKKNENENRRKHRSSFHEKANTKLYKCSFCTRFCS